MKKNKNWYSFESDKIYNNDIAFCYSLVLAMIPPYGKKVKLYFSK